MAGFSTLVPRGARTLPIEGGASRALVFDDEEITLADHHNPAIAKRCNKVDRFTELIMRCSDPLIPIARRRYAKDRIGVFIGNMLAGWQFGEVELANLHLRGINRLSAYQATAWFPAAAQGELTIGHDLQGFSKTVSGGLCCGLEALLIAIDSILLDRVDAALVCAAESLSARLARIGVSDVPQTNLGEGACGILLTRDDITGTSVTIRVSEGFTQDDCNYAISTSKGPKSRIDASTTFFLGAHALLDICVIIRRMESIAHSPIITNIQIGTREFEIVITKGCRTE